MRTTKKSKRKTRLFVLVLLIIVVGTILIVFFLTRHNADSGVRCFSESVPINENTLINKYSNSPFGFSIRYPKEEEILWSSVDDNRLPRQIVFGRKSVYKKDEGYDGDWFITVYRDSEKDLMESQYGFELGKFDVDTSKESELTFKNERICINGISATKQVDEKTERILIKNNKVNYLISNGGGLGLPNEFGFFYKSFRFEKLIF